MLNTVLFAIGFIFLIKGADLLVDGAASIAGRLNISDLVIGLTVVAFGTSTPELFVNVIASFKGNADIAIGNVLGSNIANILFILGVSATIYPLAVTKGTVRKEIPFSLLAAVVLLLMANDRIFDGAAESALTRIDGLVFLCFFILFLYTTFSIATRVEGIEEHVPAGQTGWLRPLLLVILGLAGLTIGGKWIVDGAVDLAARMGMSESLIGLTIVAVGTSLPELATSAMAAYKKNADIAVGNVVGSNIFNIFFVLGISAGIKPLPFQPGNIVDLVVVIFCSLLLFFFMFTGKKRAVDRWEGFIFLLLYLLYIAFLIMSAR